MRHIAVASGFMFVSLPCRLCLDANSVRFQLAAPSGLQWRGALWRGWVHRHVGWMRAAPNLPGLPDCRRAAAVAGILGDMCPVILLLQPDATPVPFSPLLPVGMLHAPYTCLVLSWLAKDRWTSCQSTGHVSL